MAKETRLNDSAEIYKPRKNQTEKQKLQDMTGSEKWTYFKDYYLMKSVIAFIVIAGVIYFTYTVLSPKPETFLYVAVINDFLDEEEVGQHIQDLQNSFGLDSEKQEIMIDSSYYIAGDASAAMGAEQKIATYLAASEIDIIIADEDQFKKYAEFGYFSNLADELPTEIYSYFSDSFFLTTSEESNTEYACGIYLKDSEIYKQLGTKVEKPIMGIVVNSKHPNNAVEYIKYLFELNK